MSENHNLDTKRHDINPENAKRSRYDLIDIDFDKEYRIFSCVTFNMNTKDSALEYHVSADFSKDKQLAKIVSDSRKRDLLNKDKFYDLIERYMKTQLELFSKGNKTNGMKVTEIEIPEENKHFDGHESEYNFKPFTKAFLEADELSMNKVFNNVTKDTKEITGWLPSSEIFNDIGMNSEVSLVLSDWEKVYTCGNSFFVPSDDEGVIAKGTLAYYKDEDGEYPLKSGSILTRNIDGREHEREVGWAKFDMVTMINIEDPDYIPHTPKEAKMCNELAKYCKENNPGHKVPGKFKFTPPSNWNKKYTNKNKQIDIPF